MGSWLLPSQLRHAVALSSVEWDQNAPGSVALHDDTSTGWDIHLAVHPFPSLSSL
jgi:hypothetical protein